MIHIRRLTLLVALITLSACSSVRVLAPTSNIFTNNAYPRTDIPQAYQTAQPSIFYVTDRYATRREGGLSYGTERSSSMAFGSATVAFGEGQDWLSLSMASGQTKRSQKIKFSIVESREILRFDKTPIPFEVVNGKPVKTPEAVASYNRKRAAF